MNVDQLVAKFKGKAVDVDGFPPDQPFQCFDLFIQAVREATPDKGFYVVCRSTGLAQDLYNDFASNGLGKYFDRIPASQPPMKNDVAIWGQCKAAPLSHVAIVMGDGGSALQVFQQNAPYPYCSIGNYTKAGLLGYLRFKGGDMIQNTDDEYNWVNAMTLAVEGKGMTREYFAANVVGRELMSVLKDSLSSPNAKTIEDYVKWGKMAKDDNWQGQIANLQKQLTAGSNATELKPGIYEVKGAI